MDALPHVSAKDVVPLFQGLFNVRFSTKHEMGLSVLLLVIHKDMNESHSINSFRLQENGQKWGQATATTVAVVAVPTHG